jgi:hypothetical protein
MAWALWWIIKPVGSSGNLGLKEWKFRSYTDVRKNGSSIELDNQVHLELAQLAAEGMDVAILSIDHVSPTLPL